MKAPSQVGNGENYPSSDGPDRGVMPGQTHPGCRSRCRADSNVRFAPLAGAGHRHAGTEDKALVSFEAEIADREIE